MGSATALQQTLRGNRCYVSLACSIGSMSLACGSLLQIPNTTDRISLQRGLFLTSLGFIYFISLTDFCNKYLLDTRRGELFRKKYRLMMSDVLEITNKTVSAIQAAFSFLVGFVVCKSTCSKSFVYASHFLMEAYGWFATAYFMYDIWSMYTVHTQKIADKLRLMRFSTYDANAVTKSNNAQLLNSGLHDNKRSSNGKQQQQFANGADNGAVTIADTVDNRHGQQHVEETCQQGKWQNVQIPPISFTWNFLKYVLTHPITTIYYIVMSKWDFIKYVFTHPVMMIHHVFIGTFGLLVVTYIRGGGHCIYSYMYMMEFSTPFVSIRSILSTMRLKESRIYIVNGLLMLGSFFLCRIVMWPYVMWRYSVAIDAGLWQATIGLPRGCLIAISILFLPQIYWFYLMLRGAIKVFFPPTAKRARNTLTLEQQQKQQSKNNNLSPLTDNAEESFDKHTQLAFNGINHGNEELISAALNAKLAVLEVNGKN